MRSAQSRQSCAVGKATRHLSHHWCCPPWLQTDAAQLEPEMLQGTQRPAHTHGRKRHQLLPVLHLKVTMDNYRTTSPMSHTLLPDQHPEDVSGFWDEGQFQCGAQINGPYGAPFSHRQTDAMRRQCSGTQLKTQAQNTQIIQCCTMNIFMLHGKKITNKQAKKPNNNNK